MRSAVFFTVFFLWTSATVLPQASSKPAADPSAELKRLKAEQEQIEKARVLVREWFRRWNSLDGTEDSINRFVELYHTDALHETGPQDNLIGTAFYQDHVMIRKLAENAGKTYCRQAFYIKMRTSLKQVADGGGSKTVELMTAAPSQLGEISLGVEFGGSYDYRESKKRFMAPGAAFFDVRDGKIARLRTYYSKGEQFEVTNQTGCTN